MFFFLCNENFLGGERFVRNLMLFFIMINILFYFLSFILGLVLKCFGDIKEFSEFIRKLWYFGKNKLIFVNVY